MSVDFLRPRTVREAIACLAADDDARLLAGGQSLVATLAMGVYQPSALISLLHIESLRGIQRDHDGAVRIGAMTTHAEIAESELFACGQSVMPSAAAQIASPSVRNFGTIGGSCAHADPAADWPSALVAASAVIHACGPNGERSIPADLFFLGFLTTDLAQNEIITAIEVPALAGRGLHRKFVRVVGDYATISVSVVAARVGSDCATARIAVGSYDDKPVRSDLADATLAGQPVSLESALVAGRILQNAGSPRGDVRGSAGYRRRVLPALVARGVMEALA